MSQLTKANKPRKTSAYLQLMSVHWVMYYCYLILFCGGAIMARLPRELFIRNPMYDFHKGMGVLVMGLLTLRIFVLLRVWWKKYAKRSPKFTQEWAKKVALHATLYLFMWAVPLTGFFYSNSFQSNNVHFLWLTVPDLFPQNSELVDLGRNLHFWFAYTFAAFIILHIIDQRKVVQAFWRRVKKGMQMQG